MFFPKTGHSGEKFGSSEAKVLTFFEDMCKQINAENFKYTSMTTKLHIN